MKKIAVDAIVFDLDGTLVDSKQDIANALNSTFETVGYAPLPMEIIEGFVGNGVAPLIKRAVEKAGGREEKLAEVTELFRRRYWDGLLDNTRLYEGVPETIESFRGRYHMAVISNKPQRYVHRIVEELGLAGVFNGTVYGGDTLSVKKPDPTAMLEIADKFSVTPARMVMIGDSCVDIMTAKNAGASSVGVTYGFRKVEELVEAGADCLIDRFAELMDILG